MAENFALLTRSKFVLSPFGLGPDWWGYICQFMYTIYPLIFPCVLSSSQPHTPNTNTEIDVKQQQKQTVFFFFLSTFVSSLLWFFFLLFYLYHSWNFGGPDVTLRDSGDTTFEDCAYVCRFSLMRQL